VIDKYLFVAMLESEVKHSSSVFSTVSIIIFLYVFFSFSSVVQEECGIEEQVCKMKVEINDEMYRFATPGVLKTAGDILKN